jgi:1,4-dihydroxy-2-naphthoate octaprenyltransferase
MNVWALHWRMTRPAFLTITIVGCLIGFASAWACGCGFDPLRAVVALTITTAHLHGLGLALGLVWGWWMG